MIGEVIPLSLLEYNFKNSRNMPIHKRNTILKLLSIKYMKIKEIENPKTKNYESRSN